VRAGLGSIPGTSYTHRGCAPGLSIDLVPANAWFTNVRTAVTRTTWERLRTYCLRTQGPVEAGGLAHLAGDFLDVQVGVREPMHPLEPGPAAGQILGLGPDLGPVR